MRAKELLKRKSIGFEEIKISWDDESAWKKLEAQTGLKTVPQFFFGETCIGGYTDLAALDQAGKIPALLEN